MTIPSKATTAERSSRSPRAPRRHAASTPRELSSLVLVSNRLPATLRFEHGAPVLKPSTGGLATALAGPHGRAASRWVGWSGSHHAVEPAARADLDAQLDRERLVAVELSAAEVKSYYDGFSNGVLWPLLHYFIDKVRLDADHDWEVYRAVNARFADAVAATSARGALVWVHDYQLMLVPKLLRAIRPDLRIGFFLHVPFPSHEVFRVLPWRAELLRGVLGADLVGFHTPGYAHHFVSSVAHVLGTDLADDVVEWEGRRVGVGAFPIGIDVDRFAREAASEACAERVRALRAQAQGRAIVLGVDRLDYTKGIPRRLLSIERLLDEDPSRCDRIHYVQVAVPTREGVDAYADYRRTVNDHVGRINGEHGRPSCVPIHLLHHAIPFEELVALYRAADVMVVTPLRDGMNLVAKEYCACRPDDSGVLILSELAGAAQELTDALLVNPYDIGGVTRALRHAMDMAPDESARRMRSLRETVASGSSERWSRSFLDALEGVRSAPSAAFGTSRLSQALDAAVGRSRHLWLIDYDGTLAPYAETPERAAPDPALIVLLERLCGAAGARVEIVSGRPRETLDAWLGALPLGLHAEHGLWSRARRGEPWRSQIALDTSWRDAVRDAIEPVVGRLPGSIIEVKSASIVWHYRRVLPELASQHLAEVRALLAPIVRALDLRVVPGAKSIEVRPARVDKGLVAARLQQELVDAAVIAAGDDTTDEDMFKALPEDAVTIKVGPGVSVARYRVDGVASFRLLLAQVISARAEVGA